MMFLFPRLCAFMLCAVLLSGCVGSVVGTSLNLVAKTVTTAANVATEVVGIAATVATAQALPF